MLAILRDYGLCQGRVTKRMIEPDVPRAVAFHLLHLLRAEDVPADQLCTHPDWQIWLWEPITCAAANSAGRIRQRRDDERSC